MTNTGIAGPHSLPMMQLDSSKMFGVLKHDGYVSGVLREMSGKVIKLREQITGRGGSGFK